MLSERTQDLSSFGGRTPHPPIEVQVKARRDQVGRGEVSGFIGTLRQHDRGLFVSLGGFSSEATKEAARANQPPTLSGMDDFLSLLFEYYDALKHYDALKPEARTLVPLMRIYVPMVRA